MRQKHLIRIYRNALRTFPNLLFCGLYILHLFADSATCYQYARFLAIDYIQHYASFRRSFF